MVWTAGIHPRIPIRSGLRENRHDESCQVNRHIPSKGRPNLEEVLYA
jgi:hypothetical protein